MKNGIKIFCVIHVVLIFGCCAVERQNDVFQAQQNMRYNGKIIPPFFVKDFCDLPQIENHIVAVRVSSLFDKTFEDFSDDNDGWVSFFPPDGSHYRYKLVGTTPSGITVLQAIVNTGGSGSWIGVLFCKFEKQKFIFADEQEESLALRYYGDYFWGDRIYRDVKLVGNKLILYPTTTNIPAYKNYPLPEEIIILK